MTGDGFSEPDPGVPDTSDGDDAPLTERFPALQEEPGGGEEMVLVPGDASCLDCSHFEVCAVFSGIAPMMADWHTDDTKGEPPIDVERLAWICEKYDPVEEE